MSRGGFTPSLPLAEPPTGRRPAAGGPGGTEALPPLARLLLEVAPAGMALLSLPAGSSSPVTISRSGCGPACAADAAPLPPPLLLPAYAAGLAAPGALPASGPWEL